MLWRKPTSGPSSGVLTKAALDYCRLGWSVIPIEARGKRPLIRWQVHQYRCAEVPEIGAWFSRWPDANLAVVTGIVSGLVVLDLDPRHGADASLQQFEQKHGDFAETIEARTGGGGRHLYYVHPGEIIHNRVGIAPGVDLRGDGGYVVASPSVHACGEPYRWERSPDVCRLAPLPAWLLSAAPDGGAHRGHPLAHWRRLLREGVAGAAVAASPRAAETPMSGIVDLPPPAVDSGVSVERALRERRSVRIYVPGTLSLAELGQLLWAAQGMTAPGGRRPLPAGAVVVGEVGGLETGVYRYLPGAHRLDSNDPRDLRPDLAAAAHQQAWVSDNAALMVISA